MAYDPENHQQNQEIVRDFFSGMSPEQAIAFTGILRKCDFIAEERADTVLGEAIGQFSNEPEVSAGVAKQIGRAEGIQEGWAIALVEFKEVIPDDEQLQNISASSDEVTPNLPPPLAEIVSGDMWVTREHFDEFRMSAIPKRTTRVGRAFNALIDETLLAQKDPERLRLAEIAEAQNKLPPGESSTKALGFHQRQVNILLFNPEGIEVKLRRELGIAPYNGWTALDGMQQSLQAGSYHDYLAQYAVKASSLKEIADEDKISTVGKEALLFIRNLSAQIASQIDDKQKETK